MSADEVVPDWSPMDDDEVARVLANLDPHDGSDDGARPRVTWISPRPMSSAALVVWGESELFVKRHDPRVRHGERLHVEHSFAHHLRQRGVSVPRVKRFAHGDTVLHLGEALYEVHELAAGVDLYRDTPSWFPYRCLDHARAAGVALAQLHDAARDFAAPATQPGVLSTSVEVVGSHDPVAALRRLVAARPALARALAPRPLDDDVESLLGPALVAGAASLAPLVTRAPQWGHGDWHPSNVTWTSSDESARVASVFDLGLANRTTRVHDLAVALERSAVDWLDVAARGEIRAHVDGADAFLDGYESVRPLGGRERRALVGALPVAHVEFALSEIEYFADVVDSPSNAALAYDGYLIGHVHWFADGHGREFISHLEHRWREEYTGSHRGEW